MKDPKICNCSRMDEPHIHTRPDLADLKFRLAYAWLGIKPLLIEAGIILVVFLLGWAVFCA